jgi:hypothetical protein
VRWLLLGVAGLLIAAAVPPAFAADPGEGPVTVRFEFTDHGQPVQGSLHATHWEDGAWQAADGPLDDAGSVALHLSAGQWILELRSGLPDGHPLGSGFLEVAESFDAHVDLAAGEPTVPVDVSVVDASTGGLVGGGELVAQMLFGQPQCIGLRPAQGNGEPSMSGQPPPPSTEACDLKWAEPGHLVGKVPPGVLTLRVLPEEVTCVDTPHEGQHPCYRHVPRSVSVAALDGEPLSATIPLLPVHAPDAVVEGYLVSDVTGQAIAGKHVEFQGTGDFSAVTFSASVDEDGSFRVGLPAGAYKAWAWVCGHDELTVPFGVAANESLRLDLRLHERTATEAPAAATPTAAEDANSTATGEGSTRTGTPTAATTPTPTGIGGPAETTYPACDADADPAPGPGATAPPSDGSSEPQPDSEEQSEVQLVGTLAFFDYGGGLGPYGVESGSGTTTLAEAPHRSPALAPAVLALALVGLAVRRRVR